MFSYIQVFGKSLGHDIALFLKIGRQEDTKTNSYHSEDAKHANLGHCIADDVGNEGGTAMRGSSCDILH